MISHTSNIIYYKHMISYTSNIIYYILNGVSICPNLCFTYAVTDILIKFI